MTILVAMIGSDGIVFAADQLMVRPAANVGEYDDRSLVRKIEYLATHQVAYAGVGDEITRQVESTLSSRLDEESFDSKNIRRSLEKLTSDTLKACVPKLRNVTPIMRMIAVSLSARTARVLCWLCFMGAKSQSGKRGD
jgi:hypothetical protein